MNYARGKNPNSRNGFKKGHKIWLGKKLSEEHKLKLRKPRIGHTAWNKGIGGKNSHSFGKEFSEERKMNISLSKWRGGFKTLKMQEKIAGRKKTLLCEICNNAGRICFDHCHKTGKFRGWICMNCNTALGMVNDNVEILKLLIKYVENNSVDN